MAAKSAPAWIAVVATGTDPASAESSALERFVGRARAGGAPAAGVEFRWVARFELVDGRVVHRYRLVAANRDVHLDAVGNAYRSRHRSGQLMVQADRRRPATVYAAVIELVGLDVPHSIVAGWARPTPRRSGAA